MKSKACVPDSERQRALVPDTGVFLPATFLNEAAEFMRPDVFTRASAAGVCSVLFICCTAWGSGPALAPDSDPPGGIDLRHHSRADLANAVPALVEALKSPQAGIRRNAAFALGELGPEGVPAIAALTEALAHDTDIDVRRDAAFALGEIGPDALPALMPLLSAPDARIRRSVASSLVRIGEPAVPDLAALLHSPDPIVRRNAAGILGRMGPTARSAVAALEACREDNDPAFCWTVKQALRSIKQVTVRDRIENLHDQDVLIRVAAARALGEEHAGEEAPIPALIRCLNDPKAAVRKAAALSLAKIGAPALPALIAALGHTDPQIRKNAAFSLGEMGDTATAAIPELTMLRRDDRAAVRWCADNALNKILAPQPPANSPDNATGTQQ